MAASTISSTVTNTVSLGTEAYTPDVTITATGGIVSTYTAVYGSALISNAGVTNYGNISGTVKFHGQDTLFNHGTVTAPIFGVSFSTGGYAYNDGIINASGPSGIGVEMQNATLINHGSIVSGGVGISNEAGNASLFNDGVISAAAMGIVEAGGIVENAGTITGGNYAIYANAPLTLIADPGAVFAGAVDDTANTGTLVQNESGQRGTLAIDSFSGFSSIDFAPGAAWTLEGSVTQLASGQTISGLTIGDRIVLDSFIAVSENFAPGTGLILSSDSVNATLDITGPFTAFNIGTNASSTTITPLISTISTYLDFSYQALMLGNGTYAPSLTITNSGTIGNHKLYGGGVGGGDDSTLTNEGVITGRMGLGSATTINGGSIGEGAYLTNGLVVDSGVIRASKTCQMPSQPKAA